LLRVAAFKPAFVDELVEHFGQTGSLDDLYRHCGIDTNAIVAAVESVAPGRPIRHRRAWNSPFAG
jgi:pyruvate dehydrogenase complex dehydrogenase (E1) component